MYCPLSYELVYDTTQSWLTPDANGRKISWQTDENDNSGTHLITVKATNIDGITASESFTIEVLTSCDNQVITLPSSPIFSYRVNDPAESYELDEFGND